MKKIIVLALLLCHVYSNAQSQIEQQKAVKDYSFSVYENFKWGSDAFKILMINSLRSQGYYSQLEIMKGMETIDKNLEFRKATYRAWTRLTSNVDILGKNLLAIGMSATNSEIMANYIIKFNDSEASVNLKKEQTVNYNNAMLQYQKLINSYKEGKIVERERLDLSSLIQGASLLKMDSKLNIEAENFKILYQKDGIVDFLSKHFKNEVIYFTISKHGHLLSIENNSATISLTPKNSPQLVEFIKTTGKFNLKASSKIIPVNYRFPALSFKSGTCALTNIYCLALTDNDIDFVVDTSDFKRKLPLIKYSQYCPTQAIFAFEKKDIQQLMYDYLKVNSIKQVRKLSRSIKTGGNEQLCKFTNKINREAFYLWDLTGNDFLSITEYKLLNNQYKFEVYNSKLTSFVDVGGGK